MASALLKMCTLMCSTVQSLQELSQLLKSEHHCHLGSWRRSPVAIVSDVALDTQRRPVQLAAQRLE